MLKTDLDLISNFFRKLCKEYNLEDFTSDLDCNTEVLDICFPFEDDLSIDVELLLPYIKNIDSLKIHDTNMVTTDTITQRVIKVSEPHKIWHISFETTLENDIEIGIVEDPFLIGVGAIKSNEYDEYNPPCSSHRAIEIKYPSKEARMTFEEEEELIKSFFFEISHSYQISFEFSTFECNKYDYFEVEENSFGLSNFFEGYTYGMELFIKANQSLTSDLTFVLYYKIFEYYAPFYSRIEAFEAMRKKLDSSRANRPNADFIASIFDLVNRYGK